MSSKHFLLILACLPFSCLAQLPRPVTVWSGSAADWNSAHEDLVLEHIPGARHLFTLTLDRDTGSWDPLWAQNRQVAMSVEAGDYFDIKLRFLPQPKSIDGGETSGNIWIGDDSGAELARLPFNHSKDEPVGKWLRRRHTFETPATISIVDIALNGRDNREGQNLRNRFILEVKAIGIYRSTAPTVTDIHGNEHVVTPALWERYHGYSEFIGYPPRPAVRAKFRADEDWLPYARVRTFKHKKMFTTAAAAAAAAEIANNGFNVVVSEDSRYILRNEDDEILAGEVDTAGLPFNELVENTRRLVEAFHAEGLRFIGHLTCAQVPESYAKKHPGHSMIDLNSGEPAINYNYGVAYMCYVNAEFWQGYIEQLERYIETSGIDGIMVDEIQSFGALPNGCGCVSCRSKFKSDTGITLPPNGKPGDWFHPRNADYHQWMKWQHEQIMARQTEIRSLLRRIRGPHARYWTYASNLTYPVSYYRCALTASGLSRYGDVIGIEVEPEGKPRLYTYYWRNNAAEFQTLKALGSTRTGVTWGLFYSTFAHDYTWNFLLATAMGVRQWQTVSDPGTESSWRPLLAWESVHEELLAPWRPLANTGVVFSDLTQNHHPLRAGQKTFAFGFVNSVNALTDAGIVYRAVVDHDLDNDNLDRLQTLFLPGTALLSDEAIANIRRFVANGGSLIASGQIGRYRPDSSDRGNLGLADLFGVELQRYDRKTRGARLEIAAGNIFSAGREPAGLYYNAEFAQVATTGDSKLLAELVTPDGQRWPGIVEHRFGKGRTVYFAFRPELRYALQHLSHGAPLVEPGKPWEDHRTAAFGRLIVDAVNSAGSQPVSVDNSTSGIMVDAHRQRAGDIDNIIVTMTNFLGVELADGVVPKHLDPAFPEVAPHLPDPQAPFKIHLRAPPPKSVYLVSPDYTTAARLPFTHGDGAVHVTLDRLDRMAIIVLTYGRDLVEEIYGAAIADQQPDAVDVIIREVPPLVGKYDPDAVVVFADIAPGFEGGRDHGAYKQQPSRIIYGARSPYPQVRATLTLAKLPGHPVLTVGGMDDNWPNHYAPIEILVNGTSLFKGKTDFPDNEWDTRDYEIPPGILKVGDNTVAVRNLGDSASPSTPPWFGIAFLKIADTQ